MNSESPIIFVRTGWMRFYGRTNDALEEPEGGGAWNSTHVGSECNNFQILNSRCYGYVRTGSHQGGFNLERISPRLAPRKSDRLDGVLVVIVAGSPQMIIGWYKNATLYAKLPGDRSAISEESDSGYNFEASASDCVLLPTSERTHQVPKGQGAMGQSNVYYPYEADGSERTADWIAQATAFVRSYAGRSLVEDPRLEYGKYAHRKPTWEERLSIAGECVDTLIAQGEMSSETAKAHLEQYLNKDQLVHVDCGIWPQYRHMENLVREGCYIEAYKAYEALLVDDDGDSNVFDVPYWVTPEGQGVRTVLCNAIPTIPRPDKSVLLEKGEAFVSAGVKMRQISRSENVANQPV